jgi:hypothetical protein
MSQLYETGQFRFDALDAWLRRRTKQLDEI